MNTRCGYKVIKFLTLTAATASAAAAAVARLDDVRHLGHDGVVAVVADVRRYLHPVTPLVLLADQVNLDTINI